MKTILAAIALACALPAAAQTAQPSSTPGHGTVQHHQHQAGHEHAGHGQPQTAPAGDHSQHQGHGTAAADCCADRDGDGRMDCCQNMAPSADRRGCCAERPAAPAARPQPAQPQAQHSH